MKKIDFNFSGYVENEENLRKLRKKELRKRQVKDVISKVIVVAREGLEIYTSIKTKDPISIGLGLLSGYGAIKDTFINKDFTPEGFFKSIDAISVNRNSKKIIRKLLTQADIPSFVIWKQIEGDESIIEYSLASNLQVYYFDEGSYYEGPYVPKQSISLFYTELAKLIEQNIGKHLIMEVSTDKNWDENVELKPLSICKEAFVSLIEEEKLLLTTKKFFDVGLNRSLIFYGLPGSGKTTAAYRLTENLGGRLLVVNGWSLSNRPVESILNVVNLVNPSVILFDDLDRIEDINSLLSDIEQLKKETIINSRLFIATVNNLSAIDPALRRPGRFDQAIKFDPPNLEDRYKILKVHAQQLNIEGKEKFYKDLAKATEGLTGAFLKELLLRYMILKDEKEILADINRMKEVSGLFDNCDCEDECNEISFSNILKPTVAPNVSRKRK